MLLIAPATADPTHKLELIQQILQLTDVKGTLERARLDNVALVRSSMLDQAGPNAKNPMMIRLVRRAMEKYDTYSREIFSYSKKEDFYIAFYDSEFSEQDLEGLAAFYRSPAGRALVRSQPVLARKMQESAFKDSKAINARINQIMNETISEVQEELKKEGKL